MPQNKHKSLCFIQCKFSGHHILQNVDNMLGDQVLVNFNNADAFFEWNKLKSPSIAANRDNTDVVTYCVPVILRLGSVET